MKIEIPFAVQEGKSSVPQNSREVLVNMFAEVETSGRRKLTRKQRAGLSQVKAQTGEKRCIEKFGSTWYAVISDTLYSFDGTTLTSLGTLTSSTGRCTMVFDDNGKIMISDGTIGYHWNGSALSTITHSTAIGHVTFQGGFGIFPQPGSGTFWITATNDFATIDPLDSATAESEADDIVRAIVDHNELWLFGKTTTEIWQLSGAADFPFSALSSAQIERGSGAAFSVARDDNTTFWMGDDLVIYRADGYRPSRVSTHSIERAILTVPAAARSTADALIYSLGGHKFYTLRFPGYLTLQYNIATGLWNRCKTYNYDDWRIIGSANKASDYVMTDAGICELVDGLNTDESGIMQRQAISAPIWADGKRIGIRSFFLDMEVGRAAIGVEDPQIALRVARDGETFGNEHWRSMGSTGEYTRRVTWRNLGMGRKPAFEVSVTDDVTVAIVGADADLFAGV